MTPRADKNQKSPNIYKTLPPPPRGGLCTLGGGGRAPRADGKGVAQQWGRVAVTTLGGQQWRGLMGWQ